MGDLLRTEYEVKEHGILAESHPFQAALGKMLLIATDETMVEIDKNIEEVCDEIKSGLRQEGNSMVSLNWSDISIESDGISHMFARAFDQYQEVFDPSLLFFSYPMTIGEGIEFAQDVAVAVEAVSMSAMSHKRPPAPDPAAAPPTAKHTNSSHTQTQTTLPLPLPLPLPDPGLNGGNGGNGSNGGAQHKQPKRKLTRQKILAFYSEPEPQPSFTNTFTSNVNANSNPASGNGTSGSDSQDSNPNSNKSSKFANPFKSARDQFKDEGGSFPTKTTQNNKKTISNSNSSSSSSSSNSSSNSSSSSSSMGKDKELPPELSHCDKDIVDRITSEIIVRGQEVSFSDISGLEFAKKCVTELICWPIQRPDLFQGIRALPKGILLFGPPGTGKTLIGKAIAHETGATFFSISASSLMSKWIGEGEKTVRTLFAVAAYREPAVVFMDEIDSLLCQRSSEENEASRRIKTEFMVQLDGAGTNQTARVVILGATNRPAELDEAVRRRFVKRIYIPLPGPDSRRELLTSLLSKVAHSITPDHLEELVQRCAGYSGADIRALCTEAAMGPVREVAASAQGDLLRIDQDAMPAVAERHFEEALEAVLATVSPSDLQSYMDWNSSYGSFRKMTE